MVERTQYLETIRERLERFPVVSVLGPRQVGKTTLAQQIAGEQPSHFFDLEDVDAQARLAEPRMALERLSVWVVLEYVSREAGGERPARACRLSGRSEVPGGRSSGSRLETDLLPHHCGQPIGRTAENRFKWSRARAAVFLAAGHWRRRCW